MWTTYFRTAILAASISIANGAPIIEANQTSPLVDLGYAAYEGSTHGNGVHQFLGMRYAAPPVGENRFRRARDPLNEKQIIPALQVRKSSALLACANSSIAWCSM